MFSGIARSLIRAYQLVLSPYLGRNCRFLPTCSSYSIEAIERHGVAKGSLLATRRLLKCHPLHRGGIDPVPPKPDEPQPKRMHSLGENTCYEHRENPLVYPPKGTRGDPLVDLPKPEFPSSNSSPNLSTLNPLVTNKASPHG